MRRRFGSALAVLDEAIELTRSQPLTQNLACATPALALTWLSLFAYYLEQVEGVRTLRPVLAWLLALGWCARGLVLSRQAGRLVDCELAHLPPATRPSALDTRLRVTLALGCELTLWLWLLARCSLVDPWLCALLAPLLALRGALAPSWLAAADASEADAARSALGYSVAAGRDQRLLGIVLEALLLAAALALFLNLGALIVAALSLGQDLLGLRLSFVRAFISPRNQFALLALAGLALGAFDPLRAATAAVLYADKRLSREALEVRALVEAALRPRAAKALGAIAAALLWGAAATGQAQPLHQPTWPEEECDLSCRQAQRRDDQVLVTLVSILEAPEFRDFDSARDDLSALEGPSLERWLSRLQRWLAGAPEAGRGRGSELREVTPIHVPLTLLLSGLGALVLTLASLGWWHAQRRPAARKTAAGAPAAEPGAAPPAGVDAWAGDELRALYLRALETLAQAGRLSLSGASTNGDYLRMLRPDPAAHEFASLTRLFERVHYGKEPPSRAELVQAEQLVRALGASREPP